MILLNELQEKILNALSNYDDTYFYDVANSLQMKPSIVKEEINAIFNRVRLQQKQLEALRKKAKLLEYMIRQYKTSPKCPYRRKYLRERYNCNCQCLEMLNYIIEM